MSITLDKVGETNTIHLEGPIDIACAAELKQMFLDALKPGCAVHVQLVDVTDLDVTAVQLLWAARRAARASNQPFTIAGPMPVPVYTALADAGFEPTLFTT